MKQRYAVARQKDNREVIARRKAAMAEPIRGDAMVRMDIMEDRMRAILADPSVMPRIVIREKAVPPSRVQPALMVPELLGLQPARSTLVDARGNPL